MKQASIMIAAASSGSGKTVISCALMSAFAKQGLRVAACKCGPDYIDPMFHREVLGVESENLDLFFCEAEVLKGLYREHTAGADVTITEGVMGYYDGRSLESEKGSSYDVARTLDIPVILVVPCRGMARSVIPTILGMLTFCGDSRIRGILLNRVSGGLYPRMKEMIESELSARGYEEPSSRSCDTAGNHRHTKPSPKGRGASCKDGGLGTAIADWGGVHSRSAGGTLR